MNLMLLTSTFPYHPGEQFLEGEIGILANHFDKISILPLTFNIDFSVPRRPVPENAEVVPLPRGLSTWSKLRTGMKAIKLWRGLKDILSAAGHAGTNHPGVLSGSARSYLAAALLSSLIAKEVPIASYDVIYSYWGAEKGLVLYLLKNVCPRRVVFASRVHGFDLYAERRGLERLPFQNLLLQACDLVAPCSRNGESYLRERYGKLAANVRHHHLGVRVQNILNGGSSDDVLRIVTCSFLYPVKRLELLIEALKHVSRKLIWTHIGDGGDKERIVNLSNQLQANIQPRFLGHLENEAVLDYYRNHPVDLFVNVSSSEGIPVTVMEALSFGIEPVVTDVGGTSELVKPEFGTLLDSEFQPELLASILERHRNSQGKREKAQEYQVQHFSFANYEAFVQDMLKLSRRKRVEARRY